MRGSALSWKPIAAIVATLVALAVLQYRWIGEVSRLERERLGDALLEASGGFADDLDREVSRLALLFSVPGPDALDGAWRRWREESPAPELLARVLVWSPGSPDPEELDPETGVLGPASWPPGLERLADRRGGPLRERAAPVGSLPPAAMLPWPPAVIVPLGRPAASRPDLRRRGGPAALAQRDEDTARLILLLDRETLSRELLPRLVEVHFSGLTAVPVELAVLAPDPGGDGPATVFATGDRPPLPGAPGALVEPLLQVRFFPELRPLYAERAERAGRPRTSRDAGPAFPRERFSRPRRAEGERGAWVLVVAPRAGSLDAAVARLRGRNLALSAGILGLLGTSLALVLLAARREQELARRQLALVAGITHELHTPLAALQAAGQNLEDGVVGDPQRVREYGSLVRREGGRLQRLVDQTLALAGMRHGTDALRREPVDLAAAVERAVADSARIAAPAPLDARVVVAPLAEPALALADPEATERILANLLANARKYGGGRTWVLIADDGGASVSVTVVDDGPGVAAADRAHLFEPFYRGQRALDTVAAGSGLGLYLSRRLAVAMGGSLDLADAPPPGAPPGLSGATFRLRLPRAGEPGA